MVQLAESLPGSEEDFRSARDLGDPASFDIVADISTWRMK